MSQENLNIVEVDLVQLGCVDVYSAMYKAQELAVNDSIIQFVCKNVCVQIHENTNINSLYRDYVEAFQYKKFDKPVGPNPKPLF